VEDERVGQAQTDLKDRKAELKERNNQVESSLGEAERQRMGQAQADLKQRHTELKEMDDQVRATLTKAQADLAKAEKERVGQAQTDLKHRKAELKEMGNQVKATLATVDKFLHESRSHQEKAAAAWQELAGIFQVKGEAGVVTVEEATARTEPIEKAPQKGALRNRVFAYLADHPDGARMTELAREFDVARIQMAKVVRSLMDDNKVEKRDMHYFAI